MRLVMWPRNLSRRPAELSQAGGGGTTRYSSTTGAGTDARIGRRQPDTAIATAGMSATRIRTKAQTNVDANASASGPATAACALDGRCWRGASPPEPEPDAWVPTIALRLLVIADARITDRTAVPIDAPACRMMFIAVLVRAIAVAGTACIAAVMFGIIARPIPSPW